MTERPGTIRVLIAEDAPIVRHALASLLAAEPGIELVAAAGDAEEAVEKAAATRPTVALVDVRMPGGGGSRAARGIRRACPSARVVALSAHDDARAVADMRASGARAFVLKGSPAADIVAAIRRAAAAPVVDLASENPTVELPD
jgi:DNA-binding NarL/FixJ family response regulator